MTKLTTVYVFPPYLYLQIIPQVRLARWEIVTLYFNTVVQRTHITHIIVFEINQLITIKIVRLH